MKVTIGVPAGSEGDVVPTPQFGGLVIRPRFYGSGSGRTVVCPVTVRTEKDVELWSGLLTVGGKSGIPELVSRSKTVPAAVDLDPSSQEASESDGDKTA